MRRDFSFMVLLALSAGLHGMACGADFPGRSVTILDGDRFDISYYFTEEAVPLKLFAVDAPEKGQPYWQEAKDFLVNLLAHEKLDVDLERGFFRQSDGRSLATVFLPDGSTANRALVKAGMAWVFEEDLEGDWLDRKHNLKLFDELKVLEQEARDAKRGLWADADPVPPWLYRRLRSGAYP